MRIVIDMQGAQSTGSRNRGIGRYTLSFSQAIVRNSGSHKIFLALNGLFSDTIEPIRVLFDGLLPQENIRVWQSPGPVNDLDEANIWRRNSAELVREAFLASLKPDIVLISSLFEGLDDDAVTSIGALSSSVPTAVILFDLIPLIRRQPYLENPAVEAWYERKLAHLRRANLLLAISESSRQEAIRFLGFPVESCVNISTAADPQFQPQHIDYEQEQDVRQRYGLHRPFVMYTGGIDYRKNIEGLIRAYARLPAALRACHQLAIVCSIQPSSRDALDKLAMKEGLAFGEMILTGFVPEADLIALYNLCKAFIFPSWHEGFGLPALEAMSCGRAVIGANTSSLPEVIGRNDALFDPMNDAAIAEKLAQVLTSDDFRSELEHHGLEQARNFSWDASALRAIISIEAWHDKKVNVTLIMPNTRPRLAYVSPLPPVPSGISDYSAELLPELSRYYDIDVIVAQELISDSWIKANCSIRSVDWFKVHADRYERVLYHFGNSSFHQHMFGLLEAIPGVVVLHDFFLSGIKAYMDCSGSQPDYWANCLYHSHGYTAVQQRFHASSIEEVIWRYPCNMAVLRDASGVIVHSENSRRLTAQWYGKNLSTQCAVVPLLRTPYSDIDRIEARRRLKLNNDDFVVCSFGLLSPTKLNHRLLNAWLISALAKNANCVLIFVGENHTGGYGDELIAVISQSGLGKRIRITGRIDTSVYRDYLAAADVGVQLRTLSRGETSAAVLDCMNYALPTIVNINGSMADLADDCVWKLPDQFEDSELVKALENLWLDVPARRQLGIRARETILTFHSPRSCADQYAQAIETMYRSSLTGVSALTRALACLEPLSTQSQSLLDLAQAIACSIPQRFAPRQLLIDVSDLVQNDSKNDIQGMIGRVLKKLLIYPPEGYKVEPVYTTNQKDYRYARQFVLRFLDCPESVLNDEVIEFRTGDLFIGLCMQANVMQAQEIFYQQLRNYGVRVKFVLHNLLPITQSYIFPEGIMNPCQAWLNVVSESDGVICNSQAATEEFSNWFKKYGKRKRRSFTIDGFYSDQDIEAPEGLFAKIVQQCI